MSVFKKIDPSDISITPFNVYKDYTINSTNYSSSYGVQILQGLHYTHSFGDPLKGIPITEEEQNPNGTYKGIIHDSINHLYYQRIDKPSENFGGNNPDKETRILGEKAHVISIPSTIFDLRIKSGSIKFTDQYIQRLPLDREKNLINLPYNQSSSLYNHRYENHYSPFQSPVVWNTAPNLEAHWSFDDPNLQVNSYIQSDAMNTGLQRAASQYSSQYKMVFNTSGKADDPNAAASGTGSIHMMVAAVDNHNGKNFSFGPMTGRRKMYNKGNGFLWRKGQDFQGRTNANWWTNLGQGTGTNIQHGMPSYTLTMWVKPMDWNSTTRNTTGAPGESTLLTRDKNAYFELNILTGSVSESIHNPKGLVPLQMFWGATGSNCTTSSSYAAASSGFGLATGSWNLVSVMQEFWPDCYYGSSGSRHEELPPWGHSPAKTTLRICRPDPLSATGYTYIKKVGYATASITPTYPWHLDTFAVTASNQYDRALFICASGSSKVGAQNNHPTSMTQYNAFTGSIDEVRFYEDVLTDTHIARLYETPDLQLDKLSPLTASFDITDDGYGNLVDNLVPVTHFAPKSALVGYYGFNELFPIKNQTSASVDRKQHKGMGKTSIQDFSTYKNNGVSDKVCFKEGIASFMQSGSNRNAAAINFYQSTLKSGMRAQFNNSGSIRIPHIDKLNLGGDDGFAISFWIKIPENQIPSENTLTGQIVWNETGGGQPWGPSHEDYFSDFGPGPTYYWTSGSKAGRDYATLITKSGLGTEKLINAATTLPFEQLVQGEAMKNNYPYHIELKNTSLEFDGYKTEPNNPTYPGLGTPLGSQLNSLVFRKKSGGRILVVESQTALTPLVDHHIVIQERDQDIQIWIDGVLDRNVHNTVEECTDNISDVFIGDNGTAWVTGSKHHPAVTSNFILPENPFSGSLDEIRFYDTSLSKNEIWSLYDNSYTDGTAYQENIVGNAFYEHGLLTMTNNNFPRYWSGSLHAGTANIGNDSTALFSDNFQLKVKNTRELYEQQIRCHTRASDFNLTTNPTARKTVIGTCSEVLSTQELADFATDPIFNPYVTTIGLYDEYGRLLGIGKLARPIQKLKNVDMTFIIKFDI